MFPKVMCPRTVERGRCLAQRRSFQDEEAMMEEWGLDTAVDKTAKFHKDRVR